MNGACTPATLRRIEEAGVNASAPRGQCFIDGWLVRFAAGRAKRARCVQALAPGTSDIEDRIERCLRVFANAGLRPCFRITPFSQPPGLDAALAGRGMERLDETIVMAADAASLLATAGVDERSQPPPGIRFEAAADSAAFAEWLGAARDSNQLERRAHAERLEQSPVPQHPFFACASEPGDLQRGAPLAAGLVAVEDDLAGIYDLHTLETARGRGLGAALCRHLAGVAATLGARTLYLQVAANNASALSLYRSLRFTEAYRYHYRMPPP